MIYYIKSKYLFVLLIVMFYLIHFDNMGSEETRQLIFELSGYPNGTIIDRGLHIKMNILPDDKWVVWIDKDAVDRNLKLYNHFSKMKGIKSFTELNINKSIHDSDWLWDDDYINDIFCRYV